MPADWIVPLPAGLSLREAMIYGTAGFTAAQCVTAIVERGITPDRGEIVVTGATGGVGSLAVAILAKLGYEVAAVSGKAGAARLAAPAGRGHDSRSRAKSIDETTGRCSRRAGPRRSIRSAARPLATTRAIDRSIAAASRRADWWPATELALTCLPFHSPRRDAGRHRFGQMPAAAAAGDVGKACRAVARRTIWNDSPDEATLDELPDRVQKILAGEIVGRTLVVPDVASMRCLRLARPETAGSIRKAPSTSRSPRCSCTADPTREFPPRRPASTRMSSVRPRAFVADHQRRAARELRTHADSANWSSARGRRADSRRREVCRAPAASVRWISSWTVSAPSRAILRSSFAVPVQIIRSSPQQPAARAIRERLTLLRIGAQTITSSRGRSSGVGGLCRWCSNSDMRNAVR